ncbi:unnamed protein product [Mucor hiemalis]
MAPILPKSIIDTHVHFWHPDKVHVAWVKGSAFDKHKDAAEYSSQIKNTRVQTAIYVETNVDQQYGLVEANWIYQYAQEFVPNNSFGGIGGIVAFAPVNQGAYLEGYLDTLLRVTDKNNLLKGVRESSAQFPPIQKLVAQCPRVQFILDHMGKPPCDSEPGSVEFEFWKAQLIQLASNTNVSCKVSGLMTELVNNDDSVDVVRQLKPFVQVAREAFGIDRLMFGGDWPIMEMANTTWQSWLDILTEIVKSWPEGDKEKLFVTNATRIYKLNHKA